MDRGNRNGSAVDKEFVKKLRDRMGLYRQDFAKRLGVSIRSVENWEYGICKPSGTAQMLMQQMWNDLANGNGNGSASNGQAHAGY